MDGCHFNKDGWMDGWMDSGWILDSPTKDFRCTLWVTDAGHGLVWMNLYILVMAISCFLQLSDQNTQFWVKYHPISFVRVWKIFLFLITFITCTLGGPSNQFITLGENKPRCLGARCYQIISHFRVPIVHSSLFFTVFSNLKCVLKVDLATNS